MQRKNSFWKRVSDKGYYIALAVCVLAVALSGFLFLRSLRKTGGASPDESGVQTAVLPTLNEDHVFLPDPGSEAPVGAFETVPKPVPTEPVQSAPADSQTGASEPRKSVITRPVDGAAGAAYSMDKLSYNPTMKDWRTHAGTDYAAPAGTPVLAAADGRVQAIWQDDLLGWTVTVAHDDGWVTHYANLSEEIPVRVGDSVSSGDRLGSVGRTALLELADEPHLHFAVYRNNVPQDPEVFLGQ